VLVGVSDPTAEAVTAEFQAYLGTLATGAGASSLGAKVLEKIAVALLDGVQWKAYVESHGITSADYPALFVFDGAKKRSYSHPLGQGALKDAKGAKAFVQAVLDGEVTARYEDMQALFDEEGVAGVVAQNPWVPFAALGVLGVLVVLLKAMCTGGKGDDDDDDDEEEEEEEKKEK
jgi:hypothetical protein